MIVQIEFHLFQTVSNSSLAIFSLASSKLIVSTDCSLLFNGMLFLIVKNCTPIKYNKAEKIILEILESNGLSRVIKNLGFMVPPRRIEPRTSSLPMMRSTTEL